MTTTTTTITAKAQEIPDIQVNKDIGALLVDRKDHHHLVPTIKTNE